MVVSRTTLRVLKRMAIKACTTPQRQNGVGSNGLSKFKSDQVRCTKLLNLVLPHIGTTKIIYNSLLKTTQMRMFSSSSSINLLWLISVLYKSGSVGTLWSLLGGLRLQVNKNENSVLILSLSMLPNQAFLVRTSSFLFHRMEKKAQPMEIFWNCLQDHVFLMHFEKLSVGLE